MQSTRQLFVNALQHQQAGRTAAAEQLYQQLLSQDPNHADALHLLGAIHLQKNDFQTAATLAGRAIAINPNVASFHNTLGLALAGQQRLDAAVNAYRNAVTLQPDMRAAHFNLAHALINQGEVADAIAHYRKTLLLDPADPDCHSNLLYAMHFDPAYTAQDIADEAARWNTQHAEPLFPSIRPHPNSREADRKLRVGFVSADLWGHAVGRFLLPLLQNLDRDRFDVFCYADNAHEDVVSEQLKGHSHAWRSIVGMDDMSAAALIRSDQIDILVDLAAHSAMHRLTLFARKPAPVLASYLGYPGTTGLAVMDWRISDPFLDPRDAPPLPWVEKVWRLPGSYWCYQAPTGAPDVNELPAGSGENRAVTFGCLNKNYKVSQSTLAAWMQLLHEVPQSRFILLAHEGIFRQRVLGALEHAGIDSSRMEFVGVRPLNEHLAGYRRIDVALDTFPYNGGTTTCDALWMGVPVVTLAGTMPVGRAGVSILNHAGYPQWIARDEAEYVQIAKQLISDVPALANIRQSLRGNLQTSALMDAKQFAGHLEEAFRAFWREWCDRPAGISWRA